MGASDLRAAFNAVAAPRFTADRALLGYEREGSAEYQRLTFLGRDAEGNAFETKSELLAAGTDVNAAARVTARRLLDQKDPT